MRLLVIDRDRANSHLIEQRLQVYGHEVVHEPSKNEALEVLGKLPVDLIMVDPAPLNTARPFIISIRRAMPRKFLYVALMAYDANRTDAVANGMNDALTKPLDPEHLPIIVDNARRMSDLVTRLGDDTYDYPNMGGILGKSAMNQLFLTSLDRADRYGEQSYMLFVTIKNMPAIKTAIGEDAAEEMMLGLGSYLGQIRRQSDIAGRIGPNEYGSIILRPIRETEPADAAARFSDVLKRDLANFTVQGQSPELDVRLVNIPTGEVQAQYAIGG